MRDPAHLRTLDQIDQLHKLRVALAQSELARAQIELEQARTNTRSIGISRDEAHACWLAGLNAPHPDPRRIVIARDWLVAREQDLRAVRLDETIAANRREDVAATLTERCAGRDACRKLGNGLRRAADRQREERDQSEMADMHLRGRVAR